MRLIKVILSLIIIFTAYIGDYVVFNSKFSSSFLFRAFADSCLHGGLGFLSSVMFFSHENNLNLQTYIFNIAFCTFISAIIDIDHFFAAKSFYLKVSKCTYAFIKPL